MGAGYRGGRAWGTVLAILGVLAGCASAPDGSREAGKLKLARALAIYQGLENRTPLQKNSPRTTGEYEESSRECLEECTRQAVLLGEAGRVAEAVAVLLQVVKVDEEYERAQEALSRWEDLKTQRAAQAAEAFAAGKRADEEKNWREACRQYEEAIKCNPNLLPARARKFASAHERDKGDRALKQGQDLLAKKLLKAGLDALEQVSGQDPGHPQLEASLAQAREQWETAGRLFQQGQAALKDQQPELAILSLTQLLESYPYHVEGAVALGEASLATARNLADQGFPAAALILLQQAQKGCAATDEKGNRLPRLDQLKNELALREKPLTARLATRTAWEVEIVTRDGRGGASREESLDRGIASACGRNRPGNLKLTTFRSVSLPEERRSRVLSRSADDPPGRFRVLVEIEDVAVSQDRNDRDLSKEYPDHYVTEPNPQFAIARREWERASQDYQAAGDNYQRQRAEAQARIDQAQAAGGGLGLILANGMLLALQEPSRAPVDQAENHWRQTPETVRKAVMATHYYREVTLTKKALAQVTARGVGQDWEESWRWEEQERAETKYFENPRPEIGIPSSTPRLPEDAELAEKALRKIAPRVAEAVLPRLREQLVAWHVEQGEKAVTEENWLAVEEHYLDALFVDPVLARKRILGADAPAAVDKPGLAVEAAALAPLPLVVRQIGKLAGGSIGEKTLLAWRDRKAGREPPGARNANILSPLTNLIAPPAPPPPSEPLPPLIVLAEPGNTQQEIRTLESSIKISGAVGNAERVTRVSCLVGGQEILFRDASGASGVTTRGVGGIAPSQAKGTSPTPPSVPGAQGGTEGSGRQFLDFCFDVPLAPGVNQLKIVAQAGDRKFERALRVVRQEQQGAAYVLVVGITEYQDEAISRLPAAEKDAEGVYRFYREDPSSPATPEQVTYLAGKEATAKNIRKAISNQLIKKSGPDDTVIFYYAGHGDTGTHPDLGSEYYLIPYDASADDLFATAIEESEVKRFWKAITARRKIFLADCCNSGGFSTLRGVADSGFDEGMGEGSVVFCASKSGQKSLELPELNHGLFTYYLLRGLQGEADGALGGGKDKRVSVNELKKYLDANVPAKARSVGGNQIPVTKIEASGEIYLTK